MIDCECGEPAVQQSCDSLISVVPHNYYYRNPSLYLYTYTPLTKFQFRNITKNDAPSLETWCRSNTIGVRLLLALAWKSGCKGSAASLPTTLHTVSVGTRYDRPFSCSRLAADGFARDRRWLLETSSQRRRDCCEKDRYCRVQARATSR